jgi:fluoroquinolone transport system permease protein
MLMTELISRLGRSDMKLVGRDRFLILMFGFIVYIAGVLRFGLPWADAILAQNGVMPGDFIPVRLAEVFPMLVAYFLIFTGGSIVGMIVGFMLIDERDQNTLKAMLVTPVPLSRYVTYRLGLSVIFGFFIIIGMVLVVSQAMVPLWQLILIAAGGALTAPIFALFFATFSADKVQAFAIGKFASIAGWVIMIGFFIPEPFQWLFGLFPPFWVSKAYWMALEGNNWWWLALIVGIILQLATIKWFIGRFSKVAYAT